MTTSSPTQRLHAVRDAILRVDAQITMFGLSPHEASMMARAAIDAMTAPNHPTISRDAAAIVPCCRDAWDKGDRN